MVSPYGRIEWLSGHSDVWRRLLKISARMMDAVAWKNLRCVCQYFDSRITEIWIGDGTEGSKPCQERAGCVKSFEHGSTLDFWIGGESGRRINNGGFMSNLI